MKLRILLFTLLSLAIANAETFRDSDRWSVVGDSITQNGSYYAWVYLYYATRFPDRKLDVENGGISGDTADGALRRYAWDIQPRKATVATVMFGMNDVHRGTYVLENPGPEMLASRESALENYRKNLKELAGKLMADGTRVVFVTPSPFDETVEVALPRQTGVDGALSKCADFMKQLAAETGATVLDLHGPLNEINHRLQAADPMATIIGPDRIHPAAPGHFAMAYFFLKGQGAPGVVSEVDIDAATGKVVKADNAEVTGLTSAADGIEFHCLEKALPYPIPEEARPALAWVPFHDDLNREILRISGLTGTSHTLSIDGQRIGDFRTEELANGVNLAKLKNTPQSRQAAGVLALVKKWREISANGDRGVAQVEHSHLKDLVHPVSFNDAKPKLEALLATLDEKKDSYNIAIIKRYLLVKPKESQSQTELAEIADAIRAAAQPVSHTYRLTSSGTPVVKRPAPQRPTTTRIAEIAGWLPPHPTAFCPPASDRAFWGKLDRSGIMGHAESLLSVPIPPLPDDLYREYEKTGNRVGFEKPYQERLQRASDLALAESLEMKGRFLAPLREILSEILSEPTWVMPAHNLGKNAFQGKHINVDLGVSARASTLATIYQWLGDPLGAEMKERIRTEIRKRAVDPYLANVYQDGQTPFHWISGTNNWNAVCHAGVTYAALATVEDREIRARVAAGSTAYIVNFLNGFTPDGYCSEGIGYWNYGFGHFVLLAETLVAATQGHVNLYADPGVSADASFPPRVEIVPNVFPIFADCSPDAHVEPWILALLSRRYVLPETHSSAPHFLADKDLMFRPPVVDEARQAIPNLDPLRGYFPDAGVLVSRPANPAEGLAVAMKGGNNDEHHNHNDLGSYVLVSSGGVVAGDVGGERYTARTFSPQRYDSKVLNSYGHPVPVINGQLQATGKQAAATVEEADFSEESDVFGLDLTKGYPVPGLSKVKRTFIYHRDGKTSLEILDEMTASTPLTFGTALMSFGTMVKKTDDSFIIHAGRRAVLVRVDTGGIPWSLKEEPINEDTTRKVTRIGIDLASPVQTATIKCTITPLLASETDNLVLPLNSLPELKLGEKGAVKIQAESFVSETGGTVERAVRPGTENKIIRLWDADQHALEWKFSVPAEGRYYVALRYANANTGDATRIAALDGQPLIGAEDGFAFPSTTGWGNESQEWQNVLLARKNRPFIFALQPGEHTLRLTNFCGGGLNLDWIELIPTPE